MEKTFISVIVPTLNEERYIESCLKSVKNQDYDGKYEIIVVDGGSKDNTVKIAKGIADKNLVAERGIGCQQNAGAKIAKGKILLFLQADTVLSKNAFEEMHKFLKAHKDVMFGNIAYTYEKIDGKTKILNKVIQMYWKINKYIPIGCSGGPTLFVRKRAFQTVGGFKNIILEDVEIGLRLKKIGKTGVVYNTNATSSSRRFKKEGYTKVVISWLKQSFLILLHKPESILKYDIVR